MSSVTSFDPFLYPPTYRICLLAVEQKIMWIMAQCIDVKSQNVSTSYWKQTCFTAWESFYFQWHVSWLSFFWGLPEFNKSHFEQYSQRLTTTYCFDCFEIGKRKNPDK